jgi:hypothetical protein
VSIPGSVKKVPLWPLLFLAVGMIFIVSPLITAGHVPGNSGDSRFNLYVLEHFYQTLLGHSKSFVDATFFYPWPATIGFSDTHWGTGLIYAAFRGAGMDSLGAFSSWFLIGNLLNFLSCNYVFRKLGLKHMGASFGAFLYCFCLPATSQFSHVQLVYRAGVPLAVLFLQRYLETRNPLQGALMVLFVCLQAAATFYLGIFLILLMAGWTFGWLILKHQETKRSLAGLLKSLLPSMEGRRENLMAFLILVFGCFILIVSIWPNLEASHLYGFKRGLDEIKIGLPLPASFFQASHSNIWWPDHNKLPSLPLWWEQNLFPGLLMLLAVLMSFRGSSWASTPVVFVCRTSLTLMLVTTLSVFGHSLYYLLAKAPGFDAIRAICRVILTMVFPGALIAGAFVEGLANQSRRRWMGGIMVAGAMIFSIYEASNITHQRDERKIWASRVKTLEKELLEAHKGPFKASNLLVFTYPEKSLPEWWEFQQEIDAMLLSQKLGITTLNGYSGNLPRGWKRSCTTDDLLENIAAAQKFRITHGLPVAKITSEDLIIMGKGRMDSVRVAEGLAFPVLQDGMEFTVLSNSKDIKKYFLNDGWGEIEGDRVISQGDHASLIIRLPVAGSRKMNLDLQALISPSAEGCVIQIAANGVSMGTATFTNKDNRRNLEFQIPEDLPEYALINIKMLPMNLRSSFRSLWKSGGARIKRRFALYGICSHGAKVGEIHQEIEVLAEQKKFRDRTFKH